MKKIEIGKALERSPFFEVLATTRRGQVAVMCLAKGEKSGPDLNTHPSQDQFLYVVEGRGVLRTDKEAIEVGPGDLLLVSPGEPHQLEAVSEETLKTVDLYAPPAY